MMLQSMNPTKASVTCEVMFSVACRVELSVTYGVELSVTWVELSVTCGVMFSVLAIFRYGTTKKWRKWCTNDNSNNNWSFKSTYLGKAQGRLLWALCNTKQEQSAGPLTHTHTHSLQLPCFVTALVEVMYNWVQKERKTLASHLLRFMAHLVLFLRRVGQDTHVCHPHTSISVSLCVGGWVGVLHMCWWVWVLLAWVQT